MLYSKYYWDQRSLYPFCLADIHHIGPRACIGRKFAATEAVAFLTMLLRDWAVEPLLGIKKGSQEQETIDEWKNRVLEAKLVLTLGISYVPVRFTRRRRA